MESNIVLEKIFKVAKSCKNKEQGGVAKAYIEQACKLHNLVSIKPILESLVDLSIVGSRIKCQITKN